MTCESTQDQRTDTFPIGEASEIDLAIITWELSEATSILEVDSKQLYLR